MGLRGEVISDRKVQIANRIAGELKVAMQKNVNDMAEGVEMGQRLLEGANQID